MTAKSSDVEKHYARPKEVESRSSFVQRLQWRAEAFGWYSLYWNRFRNMPIEKASETGAKLISWLGPKLGASANRTARRNLKMAFPDWTEDQVEDCLAKSWANFGHIAGELPHLAEMRETGDDPRLIVHNNELIQPLIDAGQPMVFISGHLANWEVMITAVVDRQPDAEITYRAINNPHIDECIAGVRQETGAHKLAAKGIGTRALMRALSAGRSIALMNDQKFREGISVPLFGHEAMTAPGPTRLALKYKAPLVMFSTIRTGPARYEVTIHEPIWPHKLNEPADDAVHKTVLHINQWLEQQIRKAPDQWFWQHNRWPKQAWIDAGVM